MLIMNKAQLRRRQSCFALMMGTSAGPTGQQGLIQRLCKCSPMLSSVQAAAHLKSPPCCPRPAASMALISMAAKLLLLSNKSACAISRGGHRRSSPVRNAAISCNVLCLILIKGGCQESCQGITSLHPKGTMSSIKFVPAVTIQLTQPRC